MAGGAIAVGGGTGRSSMYNGRTTFYVIMVGIVAGCGGLLFGYDNGITGKAYLGWSKKRQCFFGMVLKDLQFREVQGRTINPIRQQINPCGAGIVQLV